MMWTIGMTLDEVEALVIKQALSYCGNNKAQVARMLGVSYRGLENKMDRHNIEYKRDEKIENSKTISAEQETRAPSRGRNKKSVDAGNLQETA